jgi:N-methylhydantoinase A
MTVPSSALRIAVDTGGTFTDVVASDGRTVVEVKVASTPDDPARAVLDGITQAVARLGREMADELVHGTTVATNALLEGTGATTWFVTNAGFEDLLTIGRQYRSELYALQPRRPSPLVPPPRCLGVAVRRDVHGEVVTPLDPAALDAAIDGLDTVPRSWAIVLLHAWADGADERALADRIRARRPQDHVSLSSEVLPVFREVERASTTVANAFVAPLMIDYLGRLEAAADRVDVMGSSGGRLSLEMARTHPVRTALSGPAGGVVAALDVVERLALDGAISFDMGGTSTDVALCAERLPLRHESNVGAHPIHVPMLDIHTVGAGGGSIAWVDDGGALRVGPKSAGASPGPACYGRGTEPTVTDANVVLGRLPGDTRLGGHMRLNPDRAFDAVGRLGARIGLDANATARGIVAIAVETMARAIRRVSTERGVDPRDLPLCTFGGAGGLHACALADELQMPSVILPARAGLLSAVGMLLGAPIAERSRTVLGRDDGEVCAARDALVADVTRAVESLERVDVHLASRYLGQSFEIDVPFDGSVDEAKRVFRAAHFERFGYELDRPIEAVTVRVRAVGERPAPLPVTDRPLVEIVHGPSAIVDLSSTLWVPRGWRAEPLADGGWWLRRGLA